MVPFVGLTMPQKGSATSEGAHLAAADVSWVWRLASPQYEKGLLVAVQAGSQVKTVMVEVPPPLLKSLMTSTSPVLCRLVNPLPPPTGLLPRPILFCKNQKPC